MSEDNKKKQSSISGVSRTSQTSQVDKTTGVDAVGAVKATSAVDGVGRAGRVDSTRQATRLMSNTERQALLSLIREEAEKMAAEGVLPQSTRAVAEEAVVMAVDAGLLTAEEDETEPTNTGGAGVGKRPGKK